MKRKLAFIFGILIMVAGVAIFLTPVITQAITARKQKQMMEQVKEQILLSIAEANAEGLPGQVIADNELSENPEIRSEDRPVVPVIIDPEGNEIESASSSDFSDDLLGGALEATEVTEETVADKSKLSGQKCIGIITIDKINLVYAIVEGVENYNISNAIGHFPKSVGIGKEGNCALAGHRGGYRGKFFKELYKLVEGDEVVITDLNGLEYKYKVYESFIVEPTETYVVKDLGISGKILTMITCTEGGKQRLVVRARCTSDPTSMR